MKETLDAALSSIGCSDWGVWIGDNYILAEYDSSYSIFRRADGHAWRSLTIERARELLTRMASLDAMGESYFTYY